MQDIIQAIKNSAIKIKDAIISDSTEYSTHHNATGDTQLKLDIKSDLIIEEELAKVPSVKAVSSEEKDDIKQLHKEGEFVIAYDPLDGSSLIDVNLSVGSIFGIYKNSFEAQNLVASAYVVYGPRVELVVAQEEVKLYRLDLSNNFNYIKDIKLLEKGKINASGGTQKGWSKTHKKLIDDIFADGYRLRYSGGMVPDLHQILLKGGGLFSYPSTTDTPKGKLRKLFEVFPFAFIYEKAGGESIDGKGRILDLGVSHPHDTTPCFFGSRQEIKRVLRAYGK